MRVISTGSFVNISVPGNSISALNELKGPFKCVCIMAPRNSKQISKVVTSENPADRNIVSKTRSKRRGATKYLNSRKKVITQPHLQWDIFPVSGDF